MLQFYLYTLSESEDKSKFEKLYYNNRDIMLNCAYNILKDYTLAEDAVHNAFLRILKNIKKINNPEDLKSRGYCVVTVENISKTIYNKEHKIKLVELDDYVSEVSVEQIAEDNSFIERLTEEIGKLSDIYQQVIVLKYFNNLSDKEISDTLNVPLSTVRKRLLRGKNLLKKSIIEVNEDD